jgi:8-oxo-dGTP pyrophosphatase MutT (NUDIX family)
MPNILDIRLTTETEQLRRQPKWCATTFGSFEAFIIKSARVKDRRRIEVPAAARISRKSPVGRHQVAALPIRQGDGRLEVCLVTTRTTSRWTVPKGWPMKGRKDHTAARIEAEEEAGIVGKPTKKPIGSFTYWKRLPDHFELIEVDVYLLWATGVRRAWKEQLERRVQWMSLDDAAIIVDEPGLASLLSKLRDNSPSLS